MRFKLQRRACSDEAETGIGTMIVFIAAVLVAAVAAGVLISTTGDLQEKSQRTGEEATQAVSSNIQVDGILGTRDSTASAVLQDLDLYVSLAPGASDVSLDQLRIQIQNGTAIKTLSYAQAAADGVFTASVIRDADSSFTAANPVMSSGDLIKISVDLDANSLNFEPRDEIQIALLPEIGNSVRVGFQTPNSYGIKTVVELQ